MKYDEMNQKLHNIALSYDLCRCVLKGEKINFTYEHVNQLKVSNFILAFENLVKKVSTKKISFDDIKNQEHRTMLISVANNIRESLFEFIPNDTDIELSSGKDDSELIEAIRIIYMFRNTIAHGKYVLNNNNIKISNSSNDNYKMTGNIDVSILDYFVYTLNNNINIKYEDYVNDINNFSNIEKIFNVEENIYFDILINKITNFDKIDELMLKGMKKFYSSEKYKLILELVNKYNISLQNSGNRNFDTEITLIVSNMKKLMKLEKKDDSLKFTVLYNYVLSVFSYIEDFKVNIDFLNVDSSKIFYLFHNSDGRTSQQIVGIQEKINSFIKNTQRRLREIKNIPTLVNRRAKTKHLVSEGKGYISKIQVMVSDLNAAICTSLRNCLFHGNVFSFDKDRMLLVDSKDQSNISKYSFAGVIKMEDLFDYVSGLFKMRDFSLDSMCKGLMQYYVERNDSKIDKSKQFKASINEIQQLCLEEICSKKSEKVYDINQIIDEAVCFLNFERDYVSSLLTNEKYIYIIDYLSENADYNCLYEELLELYAGVDRGQYSQSEMIDIELRICIFSLAIINRDIVFKKGAKTK